LHSASTEEAIRFLAVEPARFRYLELLCQEFLSPQQLGFDRKYSRQDLQMIAEADRLLTDRNQPGQIKVRLQRLFPSKQGPNGFADSAGGRKDTRATIISVSSGKGGVGKSTLSLNIGAELRQIGYRVVVIDGDFGTANLHVMAGLRVDRTLRDVVLERCPMEDVVYKVSEGPDIVPGSSGLFELANLSAAKRDLVLSRIAELTRLYDVVLIDTAAGVSSSVIDFVVFSDLSVVISSPEKTAITDSYALIKLALERSRSCRFGLITNRVRSAREGAHVLGRISSCARRFLNHQVLELGYVWEDSHARLAINEGGLLTLQYPRSRASLAIRKLAHGLREKDLVPQPSTLQQAFGACISRPVYATAVLGKP
jgi:flagellar biosynthesis protein FlhG